MVRQGWGAAAQRHATERRLDTNARDGRAAGCACEPAPDVGRDDALLFSIAHKICAHCVVSGRCVVVMSLQSQQLRVVRLDGFLSPVIGHRTSAHASHLKSTWRRLVA
eukprot:6057833-Prymnesium_polylepis.1